MEFVERTDYNKVITIKLVIPSGCNANCRFCYMKDNNLSMQYDRQVFLERFISSICEVLNKIDNKNPVSLDITGNEPTYDPELLKEVLERIRTSGIKKRFSRVTITSNGYRMVEVIPYLQNVVDYVNLSIHDFRRRERQNIMGWAGLSDQEYRRIVQGLKRCGITTSAVSVIHKPVENFKAWAHEFVEWCKSIGFIALRFRCDVFWKDQHLFDAYMEDEISDSQYTVITHETTSDSHWCRLRRYDGFRVFFLHGVRDTSLLTKGIEYVVSDDGIAYCDFYKRTKLSEYQYEVGKIYDATQPRVICSPAENCAISDASGPS